MASGILMKTIELYRKEASGDRQLYLPATTANVVSLHGYTQLPTGDITEISSSVSVLDAIRILDAKNRLLDTSKAAAVHKHKASDITDFSTAVSGIKVASAATADSVNWSGIKNIPTSFTPSSHNQASNTINAMTGYSKATSVSAITTSDTLNAAIGKLEKALDSKQASGNYLTQHPSISLTADTTSTASPAHGGTFTAVDGVTRDANGHVTTINTKTVTLPQQYSLPTASTTVKGGVMVGSGLSIVDGKLNATGVQSVTTGGTKGTISVDGSDIAVKGLGSNAYTSTSFAPINSPALTGTPTAPTAAVSTNSTQIATTAFVQNLVNNKIAASDAMIYKGTIGTSGTVTALPDTHTTGWTYKVITAGTYAGQTCEVGDMIVCLNDGTAAKDSDWTVVQSNIDGAVTGPASSTDAHIAVFNGASGKVIKDSGFTIGTSVPANAKFTDTTYSAATASKLGLVKIGSNITVSSGIISLTKGDVVSALGYTPPTTDTNTHYATGLKVGAASTDKNNVAASNGSVYLNILDDSTIRDSHLIKGSGSVSVTSDESGVITINGTPTTYTGGSGISVSGTSIANTGVLSVAAGSTANVLSVNTGGKTSSITINNVANATKATQDSAGQTISSTYIKDLSISGKTITITKGSGSTSTITTQDTTYNDMGGATSSAAGTHGLVPAPAAGKQASYLRGDGTWATPANTWIAFKGAASNAPGTAGYVPAPTAGDEDKFFRADGTWANPINTTYSAGAGISLSGTTFSNSGVRSIAAGSTANVLSVNTNGTTSSITINNVANATAATKATQDSAGQQINTTYIKGLSVSGRTITYTKGDGSTGTITTQDSNTWTAFKGATSSANGTAGYVPAPAKGDQAKFFRADGTWVVPTNTWTAFKGATSSAGGTAGYVPAPAAGDQAKFFKADGTWATPTNTTYSAGAGISLSGTTFSNSGVRSVAAGSNANQITVNTGGTEKTITVNNVANAATADKLTTGRTIGLSGAVTGSVTFDGSANKTISTTLSNFDASKITSGTIDLARIPKAAIPELKIVADDTARFALTTSDIQNGDTVQVTSTGKMYFVKDQTKLSSEDGYAVYTAGAASSVPWSGVTGKPSSYTPASHTQAASTITGLATVATSGSYADLSNKPTIPSKVSQLTNDSGYITGVSWSQVTNKPTSFTPASHNQASNTITALTGYSKPSSTGAIGTSDSLNAALGKLEKGLDGKLSTSGTAAKATQDSAGQQINTTYIKGLSVSGKTITYTKGDGTTGTITTQDTNTTYSAFKGATSSAAGGTGLVPAPAAGAQAKYLRADGTWQTPPDTNTTYSASNGISLSGTTFSNSGVRSISTGSSNGTISVNTNGTATDVAVKGLGSAAYTASSAYAAASHSHNYAGSSSAGGAATKAIQDGDGKTISSTYAKLSGATFTGDVVMNAPYRDTYYASNLCRHFSPNTPNQFVVKTKIKYASGTHMPVVRIYGYAYGLESPIELRVGFYIYDNKLGWAGVSCTGAWKPEVYLFSYTENSVKYVAIGFKGSCYFCGFQVDAQIGASGDFNSYFAIDGWRTENNGSNTSTNIIPSVGTNDCIKVDYKPMQTDITGNASTATKATQDNAGQQINTTYIKGLSVSGKTITYTKGDGTTGTITTQDTNTTYSAGTGISLSGTTFTNAGVRSVAAGSSSNQISVNTNGTTSTITINNVANATAASTATKATQDSAGQQINTTYIKGLSVSGKTITYTKGDGTTGTITTQDTNTTYSAFKGATSSAAGGAGLVPAPAAGAQAKYLRADGTWQTPPDTNTTYSAATSSALGLVKIGSNITNSSGTISLTKANVTDALGYTPPTTNTTYSAATSSNLGLVKIGSNISVSSGTISLTKANVTNALGYTPPTTNTTYSASNGISLSGTTFSNSGVRSIATGSSNGTISVNTNGTSANVAVKGLGSAAYTNSNAYAAASHSHSNYALKTEIPSVWDADGHLVSPAGWSLWITTENP